MRTQIFVLEKASTYTPNPYLPIHIRELKLIFGLTTLLLCNFFPIVFSQYLKILMNVQK